jgi:hypothetical protein
MDAQSVKTVEESAHISGFDAFKRVKGRKRHLLVDTLEAVAKHASERRAILVLGAAGARARRSHPAGRPRCACARHAS